MRLDSDVKLHDKDPMLVAAVKNIEALIAENKFKEAEAFCRGYLTNNSDDYETRMMLAHVLELSGKWEDALDELLLIKKSGIFQSKLFLLEAMTDRIKEKREIYEKVKSVIKSRKDFVSYIGNSDVVTMNREGISVSFHIKDHTLNLEEIFRTVRRAQVKIQQMIGWDVRKIAIEIYNKTDEARGESFSVGQNSWIAGIYNGTIRVYKYPDITEPQYLYTVITHEYAHLVMQTKLNEKCPWWLNEGFAVFASQSLSSGYRDILRDALKDSAIVPFESLEQNASFNQNNAISKLVYAQSASAVEYMFHKYRKEVLADKFLRALKQKGITYALNGIGLNYYLLERDWIRWFMSGNREEEI